jgi:hypothetical protein
MGAFSGFEVQSRRFESSEDYLVPVQGIGWSFDPAFAGVGLFRLFEMGSR